MDLQESYSSNMDARNFISPMDSHEEFTPPTGPSFYIDYEEDGPHFDDVDPPAQVIVGVCAMNKKSSSKPMMEILERLDRFEYITVQVFDEKTILEESPDKWPLCDCLISFHSKGFPLDKAVKYAELRQPMLINDFHMQYRLMDRRAVHQILKEQGVDQPIYAVLDRESGNPEDCQMVESDDSIEVNHVTFQKPFVEKPINAEDHNVYIYFPTSAGGGSQRLFRKIGSRSSVYSSVTTVRKNGSFIYEEFMPTDGTDVKVYTVGPDYAHAEARKSPALDGKVERDKDGKEIRYPVILTAKEKMIARKICIAFKQNVCGFDLLRANGKSYVCDVNGFSFVKTSPKYYDDCAKIMGNLILRQLAPQLHIPYSINFQPEDIPIVPTTYGTMMELRRVVAVIRHGDRTPKQKMKMEVRHKKFFDLFEKYGGYKHGHLKLKRPKQLQEVLDIARFLLSEIHNHTDPEIEEKTSKLEQLKAVLEMYGHFSGINRKVQLKYQPQGAPRRSSDDDDSDPSYRYQSFDGPREPSLVLILKWGGELTPAGKVQAEELGKAFRCMYPGGAGKARNHNTGDFGHAPGMGLLRLHSTFRHDLKIYASDEGRVQMTAAAFAKGFLALEGELPPILAQMVKSANMNGLLDNDNESPKYQNIGSFDNLTQYYAQKMQHKVKEKLQALLNIDRELTDEEVEKLAPTGSESLARAIREMGNPYQSLNKLNEMIKRLLDRVKELKNDPKAEELKLYHGESWELMQRRWTKLFKDFRLKNQQYDISKIPDVYDCIKYDLLHNNKILRFPEADDIHTLAKSLADIVIPQEYGITKEEKLLIGRCICSPLLKKIQTDLQRNVDEETTRLDSRYSEGVSTPHRHVRTRLYFTSESHIHSLLTILRYGGFLDPVTDEQWRRAMNYVGRVSELSYMTQIVIMMYEDPTKDPHSEERFHVELHFSPGAYYCGENKNKDPNSLGYRSQMGEKQAKEKEEERKAKEEKEKPMKTVTTFPTALDKAVEEKLLRKDTQIKDDIQQQQQQQQTSSSICGELQLRKQAVTANAMKMLESRQLDQEDAKDHSKDRPTPFENADETPVDLKPSGSFGFTMGSDSTTSMDRAESNTKMVSFVASSLMADIPERPEEKAEASTSSQSDAIDIDAAKRKRHHSGNAVRTREEKMRTNELCCEEKTSSSLEEPSDMEGKLAHEARSVSMEDNLQTTSPGGTPSKGSVKSSGAVRRPKRHSMGFLSMQHYPKFNLDNLRIGGKSSLISTKVINGSSSAPDLTDIDSNTSATGGVEGWKVPSIRPLETLHNSLTHKQVEAFLQRITETTSSRTPMSSPSRGPSTPVCVTPRSNDPPPSMLGLPGYESSTCSSGGPSSPTSASNPDDIMSRLRQLIARNESSTGESSRSRPAPERDSSEPPSPMVLK